MSEESPRPVQRGVASRHRFRRGAVGVLGAGATVGASVVLFAPAAHGATFTVTNTNDAGAGSLRQAVADANASAGHDDITFGPSATGTITLTTGAIDVADADVTIKGPGAQKLAIDGGGADRIFTVEGTDHADVLVISGLTLKNGSTTGDGGAVRLDNNTGGTITFRNAVVTGNHADGNGGALYIGNGTLTAYDTSFTDNTSNDSGGALWVDANDEVQTLRNVTISGNSAGDDGGGVVFYSLYNTTLVENSTISGNTAGDHGGGVYFYTTGSDIPDGDPGIIVRGTTVSGNTSGGDGGGVYFSQDDEQFQRSIRIENSTISGNEATAGSGGGISLPYLDLGTYAEATMTIDSSTIAGNKAPTVGGLYRFHDDATVTNSIVANNTNGDLGEAAGAPGTFKIAFDLIETPGSAAVTATTPGSNKAGVDPKLGPLANNGGPTRTILPQPGSPAIDGGSTALTKDQRGRARPVNMPVPNSTAAGADGSDIGAVEVGNGICGGREATIVAVPGKVTNGTPGPDVILGTAGPDTINGGGGNDLICGGEGDDHITGGSGNDRISGAGGNDVLAGGTGNDTIAGGLGNDRIAGASGRDRLFGNYGSDRLSGGTGNDLVWTGGGSGDIATGGGGDDRMSGGPGADRLAGGPGDDRISGLAGNDNLWGNGGDDFLSGGYGNDVLVGGPGKDRVVGGAGNDTPDREGPS